MQISITAGKLQQMRCEGSDWKILRIQKLPNSERRRLGACRAQITQKHRDVIGEHE